MQQGIYEVKRERFSLVDDNQYILQGNIPQEYEVEAWLDDQKLKITQEPWGKTSAMDRFADLDGKLGEKVTVRITLPQDLSNNKILRLKAVSPNETIKWFSIKVKELEKRRGKPMYFLEEEVVDSKEKTLRLRGWVAYREPVEICLYDAQGKRIPCNPQWSNRVDVVAMFDEIEIDQKCGFYIEVEHVDTKIVYLTFRTKHTKTVYPIHMGRAMAMKRKLGGYIAKGNRYLRTHGFTAFVDKVFKKAKEAKNKPLTYQEWLSRHLPTEAELAKQRETTFKIAPKISIVVPLYKTPEAYLRKLVDSVRAQTYTNWELCLSDGSGADSPLTNLLQELAKEDERIKTISSQESLQISENTNAAIALATGDWIAFADHDDELTPDALYHCVKALNDHPKTQILYTDEDKMTMDGNKFFQPHMKPGFNLDLLCTVNYICHLFVVKKTIIDQVGMLRKEYDGAQDYDFIFRCIEAVKPEEIYHIPRVLYHWRSHEDSTAENPESKTYAFDAGVQAVQAHYDRMGIPATVSKGEYLGLYKTKFLRSYDPLISIIIPNKDHTDDLDRCISSIEKKSTYKNYEFVIIENNSEEQETFDYYKKLEAENEKAHVITWEGPFNYSAINNYGVNYAKGEYILLLNNDTEIINDDCLEELLGYCMRDDVGAVGARLYFEDDTIQHAGVVIGFGGIAGHCFVMQPRGTTGYCHRIISAQDYSAVTAACMMVKKKAFEEVGGLSEDFEVAFNDIDFCLKLRDAGYLIVYNPYAELYHYESKSRGLEDTPEKVERFNGEIAKFEKKWTEILRDGDPYYNPNLSLETQDFSLKQISRR